MPVGVQCPIAPSLSLPKISSSWCPGLSPVLVSIALPFAFHTWCFPIALICHWISIVFLLYGRRIATHLVDPSPTHFLGDFPGLGVALVPDVVVPEADSDAHGAGNSIQISRLLRHAGGYSRTILTRTCRGIHIYIYIHIYNRYIYIIGDLTIGDCAQ